MWGDVCIGKGQHLCSAVICYKDDDRNFSISENQTAYWLSDIVMDLDMTIYKDTEEGKKIKGMLECDVIPRKHLYEYVVKALLKRLPVEKFISSMKAEREKWYEEGKQMKADEIKTALGIFR